MYICIYVRMPALRRASCPHLPFGWHVSMSCHGCAGHGQQVSMSMSASPMLTWTALSMSASVMHVSTLRRASCPHLIEAFALRVYRGT